ncbi:hypothetical protein Mgra_00007585 [Meloidogyne graminicola]|uniref:G_PROTEIN_RECEP_F1_2 domain-containing protein n=1 Tax=Meloidogyne graminicola TaxID=189291 RepID=A0A8S9ZIF6_9BILA|nr:hypothetical protein Mgra_00007585 [Meloidogyne graminicola]
MLLPIILCPTLIIYAEYQIIYTVPETNKIICISTECSWGWASDLIYYIFILFYGLTLINYIIVWIVLKLYDWKNINNNNTSSFTWTRRILKILTIIMILNIMGFSMNIILRLTVPHLNLNITQKTITIQTLTCLTCFVMSSNAPIFFTFNEEYKNSFFNVFKIKKSTTKVTNVNSLNNIKKNNYNQFGLPQIK